MIPPKITRIALYVRDLGCAAAFYEKHFGFRTIQSTDANSILLTQPSGGCSLLLLQASKGLRLGQSCVKIVFDVDDVAAARERYAQQGLKFGVIHRGPGYTFSNARDPAKNLIQISSRHRTAINTG